MYVVSALLLPSAILYIVGAYAKGKDFRAEQSSGDGDGEKLSPSGGVAVVAGAPVVHCSWHPPSVQLALQIYSAVRAHPVQGSVKSGTGQLSA